MVCPRCGRESPWIEAPMSGTERARRFQYARAGAEHFLCPNDGAFSVRPENVDGGQRAVAVFLRDDDDTFVVIGFSDAG